MKTSPTLLRVASAIAALAGASVPAFAQHHDHAQHATQATTVSSEQDAHAQHHDHAQHATQATTVSSEQDAHAQHDHAAMTKGAATTPHEPIPPVTADDLAAAFPDIDHHAMQHAPAFNRKVTFNRLEAWDADEGTGQAWEGTAWFGTDTDRLWLRVGRDS
ncbi:copper resistance protein B [Pseudoxanthomonas sp. LjRoot125]|uniref:copper resistance protein B n=1 Tax=Pseudoxanthomonas sp. LjRoot125 TaxID=3342258 RepID=UPI003E119143